MIKLRKEKNTSVWDFLKLEHNVNLYKLHPLYEVGFEVNNPCNMIHPSYVDSL